MKNKDINEWIEKNSLFAIIIVLAFLLISSISIFLIIKSSGKENKKTVTTVSFVDGKNEITVDRNTGKVTIKTPTGTFTQYWDQDKINRFFAGLDDLDFESLSKFIITKLYSRGTGFLYINRIIISMSEPFSDILYISSCRSNSIGSVIL